jgi:hypothetical protein
VGPGVEPAAAASMRWWCYYRFLRYRARLQEPPATTAAIFVQASFP